MTLEHAAVREALIGSALKLMDKGGLEGVKARAVADLAGVSVGTVYNLFGNFDGLIIAANLRIYDELGAVGRSRMVSVETDLQRRIAKGEFADTPRNRMLARLMGLGDAYLDFVAANANRWSALLAFNRTRGVQENEDNLQQLNALVDILGDVFKGVTKWPTADERRVAGRALWSAVHGIVTTNFVGNQAPDAREWTMRLLELMVTTFTDGVFAPQPPAHVALTGTHH